MKKCAIIVLLSLGVWGLPATSTYAAPAVARYEKSLCSTEMPGRFSSKKVRKIQRLQAKITEKLEQYTDHHAADFWLWMGLFTLGLGVCLSLFSATLGGIVAAAGLACLFIWGFFKLGAL